MSAAKVEKAAGGGAREEAQGFWGKNRDNLLLGLLLLYVILLGIGTVAELFHIESILRWPIYR